MTDEFGEFRRPSLHLVIADDEVYWRDQLANYLVGQIEEWSFHRTGQFHYQLHCCGSYQEFTEITGALTETGDLVYATADLVMPYHKTDEATDRTMWKQLIFWCLERERDPRGVGDRFQFCVISGQDQMLTELFQDARHGAALERHGVKRLFKRQLLNENEREVALQIIWDDVRAFVLSNLRFCTVPESWAGTASSLVWFGRHASLLGLLERADEVAQRRQQGESHFYIVFADACGYEEQWFRLCCHLMGVERPQIRNLAEMWRDDAWRKDLQSPPTALLLSHIRGSLDRGQYVYDHMREVEFFSALDKAGGFACFQFPEVESDMDVGRLLEPKETLVLEACFERVYKQRAPFTMKGRQYRESDHIIRFPSYDILKAAGVIRATIGYAVRHCQSKFDLSGIGIDPEVMEILAEMPWTEPRQHGLDGLTMAINVAYEKAATCRPSVGRYIDLTFFPRDPVQDHFGSSRGFAIRGARLVRLLDGHWSGGWSTLSAAETKEDFNIALEGLEQIHDLFESLQRLMDLAEQLQNDQGRIEFSDDFRLADFEALRDAHAFLLRIFKSSEILWQRVNEFARYRDDRNWRDNYPNLEARDDWREVIEHVRFIWPYRKFRLPTPIDDYLRSSGVVAEIYREMEAVLPRHSDLELQWQELETKRRALEEELQEREVQRRAARRYAREAHSQPVLVLLGQPRDGQKIRFTTTLQSFLFFHAAVAVCENVYRFAGAFCEPRIARQFLDRCELGLAVQVLRTYRDNLTKERRLQDSVFRRWVDEWPHAGRQDDAARVIGRIAASTLGDQAFRRRLTSGQKDVFRRLSELRHSPAHCPVTDVLTLMGWLRNMFDKNYAQRFWDKHLDDVHDAIRGFVLATTDSDLRFGHVSEDGERVRLWSRNGTALEPPVGPLNGRLCLFDQQPGASTYSRFPIDDLVRISPDDNAPYVWSAGKWVDLTSTEAAFTAEAESEWLPKPEERACSSVWRWTYDRSD